MEKRGENKFHPNSIPFFSPLVAHQIWNSSPSVLTLNILYTRTLRYTRGQKQPPDYETPILLCWLKERCCRGGGGGGEQNMNLQPRAQPAKTGTALSSIVRGSTKESLPATKKPAIKHLEMHTPTHSTHQSMQAAIPINTTIRSSWRFLP